MEQSMKPYISPKSIQYFAFNIWSIESAKAILDAASKVQQDVILQTSMKAFQLLDKKELHAFVNSYQNEKNIHAYLHLDHCREIASIEKAIAYGWDSVMLDASNQPLEENIRMTNLVSAMAKKQGVLVEAEIGQIQGVEDSIKVTEAGIANFSDIQKFIANTEIDMLAAAIGTSHGMYQGAPKIHYDLIEKISDFTEIPLVIHGGTGLSKETFQKLLSYKNIKKINISTDVKLAYRQGIDESIQKGYLEKDGFDPLKMVSQIHNCIEDMAIDKMKLLKKE